MQGWWRTVLRLRFFYLRELLLGVLVWEKNLLVRGDRDDRLVSQKNRRGDQAGVSKFSTPIAIKVARLAEEQEIFSSDQYQRSVHRGLTGELRNGVANLPDANISSWTAVSAMLDKRKKQLNLLPATKPQTNRQNEDDKVGVSISQSTVLDFSRPSRRQFLLELMPVGLKSRLLFKQEAKSKTLKKVHHDGKRIRVDKVKTKRSLSYWLSWFLIVGGILIAITYVAPDLYFKLVPADVIKLGEIKGAQNDSPTETQATPTPTPTPYVPPIDPDLPAGQWLIIPEIGIKTQPQATQDPEVALKDGVWISPDYGQIGQSGMPIIMAAHRFGWKWWWQSDYWKLNSFYNLPETKEGTIVELIADQRKWTYLIYGGEEGDAITDYGADLILYTCKFLNSPIRHVRYARLIDPTRPELIINQDSRSLSDEEKTELGKLFALPY